MGYYNEIFIEREGILSHIGSCDGSNTPSYFYDISNLNEFYIQIEELKKTTMFWDHNDDKHPYPWKTYKTSDNLIVLRRNERKWFEFWKPTHKVFLSENEDIKDDNKCYFIDIKKSTMFGHQCNENELIILNLPKLK